MKKTLSKILCLTLAASMLSGCSLLKKLFSNKNSSSEPETSKIDETIALYLDGKNVTVPSLGSYNMEYEVFYYYSYQMYVFSASCPDSKGTMDEEFNKKMTSDTNFVVYNDDDYTVEDYGYMYADDFNNATVELDFISEEGYFSVNLYRFDGKAGKLDVSNIDTSWYVDYVKFDGYQVSDSFPNDLIKSSLKTSNNIPAPSYSGKYCYGFTPAYVDDYYGPVPSTFTILMEGDICGAYSTSLYSAGWSITIEEAWTLTEDWDIVEYDSYNAIDNSHEYYANFYSLSGITYLTINKFSDMFTDQLTANDDWTDSEKTIMNNCLGQVMPFIKMGVGYQFGQESSNGDNYIYIADNYYIDRTELIIEALLDAGFVEDSTSYNNTCYVLDNYTSYIEVFVGYSKGNQMTIYYEASHYVPATAIALNIDALDIVAGATFQLEATLTPANAMSGVTFSSNNESVATVSDSGLVTIKSGAANGSSAVITATTTEGIHTSATFTVVPNVITGLTANVTELRLAPGEEFELEIQYLPYGVTQQPALLSYNPSSDIISASVVNAYHANITAASNAAIGATGNLEIYIEVGPQSYSINIPVTIVEASVTDTLTATSFGVSGTTYGNHTATGTTGSYSAYCAGDNDSIQIRSKNGDSGVLGSCSGKKCKSITITFEEHTAAERTVDIYASNSSFTIANASTNATNVGSVSYDGTNATVTYNFEADYQYICLKSKSGAIYMSSVEVVWQ